ncbi:hypothetical protein [Streptomyces sp. DSM 41931]
MAEVFAGADSIAPRYRLLSDRDRAIADRLGAMIRDDGGGVSG